MFLIECSIRVTSEVNSLGGALHKSCSYKWKTVAVFRPFGIQDDNVKCPNYVPRGCYRPSYFFFSPFPGCWRTGEIWWDLSGGDFSETAITEEVGDDHPYPDV